MHILGKGQELGHEARSMKRQIRGVKQEGARLEKFQVPVCTPIYDINVPGVQPLSAGHAQMVLNYCS